MTQSHKYTLNSGDLKLFLEIIKATTSSPALKATSTGIECAAISLEKTVATSGKIACPSESPDNEPIYLGIDSERLVQVMNIITGTDVDLTITPETITITNHTYTYKANNFWGGDITFKEYPKPNLPKNSSIIDESKAIANKISKIETKAPTITLIIADNTLKVSFQDSTESKGSSTFDKDQISINTNQNIEVTISSLLSKEVFKILRKVYNVEYILGTNMPVTINTTNSTGKITTSTLIAPILID